MPWVDVRANGAAPALTVYQAGTGPILSLVRGDTSGTPVLRVDGFGRVGIGVTTPTARLLVRNESGGGTSDVRIAPYPTGLGDSLLNIETQAGRIFGVNAFGGGTNLIADLGVNYAVNSDNGTIQFARIGVKKAPVLRLNAEDGSIPLFGESGTGSDFRTPTLNLGVLVTGAGRVGIGTVAPASLLHVANGASDGRMQITNNATGNGYADGL